MCKFFDNRRVPALLLVFFMLSACAAAPFAYGAETDGADEAVKTTESKDLNDLRNVSDLKESGRYCGYNLEDFENNEVLAVCEDGATEVYSYDSREELERGLEELMREPSVAFVQPNFEYAADALSDGAGTDELFSEQWALYNDGTFEMEDEANDYPVYDDPFDQPFGPGQWISPWPSWRDWFPGIWFQWSSGGSSDLRTAGGLTRQRDSAGSASSSGNSVMTSVSGIDVNVKEAWNIYRSADDEKKETVIALIDTGVDTGHEDFGDVFWINEDEIAGNGVDDDGNGYVDDVNGWNFYSGNNRIYVGSEDSHGTHGAGSIAAASENGTGISGIAGDGPVKIMVLKALGGKDGSGTTDSVIRAIRYAEANGASVCNLSMGTESYDRALRQTMESSGMLFVVSAGNDGENTDRTPCYPASFDLDNIISVANLQPDGELHATSNYGAQSVDIAVPGTFILSLTPDDTYSYMTGTSMSAPILSAGAAMILSLRSGLSAAEVREILLGTASPQENLSGYVATGGRLDLGAALNYATSNYESLPEETVLPFSDVSPANSAYGAIQYLYEKGIMLGTSENSFSPDSGLNRAMAVTLLGRLAGAEQRETSDFLDVETGSWYSGYVGWAAENGLVIGYGNGNFGPLDSVTAEQFGLLLERYAAREGVAFDSGLSGGNPLTRAGAAQAFYELCLALGK